MQRPDNLNDAQWQAVTHPGDHLLITAGPGTGKTHTLTQRIIFKLFQKLSDKKILAITFTNKAAQEMRKRLEASSADHFLRVDVGTFHKFCLRLLREFYQEAHLPQDFSIALPAQAQAIAKTIWPDEKPKNLQEKLDQISLSKNTCGGELTPQALCYTQKLRENKLLDFDDLLYEALKLLRGAKNVRKVMQERYGHIFVDEYQDINEVQHGILLLCAGDKAGVTVIGDPHQAIYGFRGSSASFFEKFLEDFPSAQKVSLADNYRSGGNLVKAAGQVIEKDAAACALPLISRLHKEGRLIVHNAPSERAEAEYIVHEIEKLLGGTSLFSKDSRRISGQEEAFFSFGDIAVLYRLNSQSKHLKEAFARSGIPFEVSGDKPLYEEQEAQKIAARLCSFRSGPKEKLLNYLEQQKAGQPSSVLEKLFDLAQGAGSVDEFLDDLRLQKENDGHAYNAQKVTLATLHASKGLEFAAVFIVGCEDGLVPLKRDGQKTDIDEERRLFYVGMTRAKELLYLVSSAQRLWRGQRQRTQLSPFVLDIEKQLKEEKQHTLPKRKTHNGQLDLFKGF